MLLIGNGRVCTRDEAAPWLEDGGVLTDGEVIRENAGFARHCIHVSPAEMDIIKETGTIVNGKVLYQDRAFTQIDEEAVNAFCMEQSKKLWGVLNGRTY